MLQKIADVILELDPDVLAVEEGPSNIDKMINFTAKFLKGTYSVFGGLDKTQQQIFILAKKDSESVLNARLDKDVCKFLKSPWRFHVDGEISLVEDLPHYFFTRRPVVIRADVHGYPAFFVALHTKSKYINGGKRKWHGSPEERLEYTKKAVKNRKRIAAEWYLYLLF